MSAMCRHIEERRETVPSIDFVLITGDIAFSGKAREYAMATRFFNALQAASGVSQERIFCVAGNHDIDRDRQNLCFRGARSELLGPSQVDAILDNGEELQTLLKRQDNYRHFQSTYFSNQEKHWTTDGLAYVSQIEVDEVDVAIIGLDSAWLANGGIGDHCKLLIGERQAINAINLALGGDISPNVIVGMAHHPLHLLQDFDRHPVQNRIEDEFHFLHCGHLHRHETRIAGTGRSGCLTLVAGASFETRRHHNAYHLLTLDLRRSMRNVESCFYSSTTGTFSAAQSKDYRFDVTPIDSFGVGDLAKEIRAYCSALSPWSHYLSALILNIKAELPILSFGMEYAFGPFDLCSTLPESDLKHKTIKFMEFRNILNVLYNRLTLREILARHGEAVKRYGEMLTSLCDTDVTLRARLNEHEGDVRKLAERKPEIPSYARDLLLHLFENQEWHLLRDHADRHVDSSDKNTSNLARRLLALALANSDEVLEKEEAIKLFRILSEDESVEFGDIGNLAIVQLEVGYTKEAANSVLLGMQKFPEKMEYFFEIGQSVVQSAGDRKLRMEIEKLKRGQS